MCGILCILDLLETGPIQIDTNLHVFLERRGPDKHAIWTENNIFFSGYVLWQQGFCPTSQPLISEKNILLLNGDIFNCDKNDEISDSIWLLEQLDLCDSEFDVLNLFRHLKGPFSVIFYNKKLKVLYFGRDSFGRNSLLIEKNKDNKQLRILSNTYMSDDNTNCIELPALGLFSLDKQHNINLYPWKAFDEQLMEKTQKLLGIPIFLKECIDPQWLHRSISQADYDFYDIIRIIDSNSIFSSLIQIRNVSMVVNKLLDLLQQSVRDRVTHTPKFCTACISKLILVDHIESKIICEHSKIGILFSGGLDCSILAVLAHNNLPLTEPIDLINIAFEKISNSPSNSIDWNVPDRCSAVESYLEISRLYPERKWNLVEVNVTRDELVNELTKHLRHLIYPLETILDESLGSAFWFAARGQGFLKNVTYLSNCRIILNGTGADEMFGGYIRHRNAYSRTNGSHKEKLNAVHNEILLDWERIHLRNLGRDDRVIADHGKTVRAPYIEEEVVQFATNLRAEQKCCFDLEQGIGDKLLLRLCAYKIGLEFPTKLKKRALQFGSRIANKNQNGQDISMYLTNKKV